MPTPWKYGMYLNGDTALALPPWDGTGVPLPVDETGWPVIPEGVYLDVPDSSGETGEPIEYETAIANYGDEVPSATETFLFVLADGTPLAAGDLVYETEDSGIWTELALTEDGSGGLTASESFPIPADLHATSTVRITSSVSGEITGTSTIVDGGGATIASATYTITVAEALPGPEGAAGGAEPAGEPSAEAGAGEPADEGYEPADGTVAEVQAYLAEHPDQTEYVLDRERAGKARSTLIGA